MSFIEETVVTVKTSVGLLVALVSLTGCAQDRSFAPPVDNQYIAVTVKVPDELVAETMKVIYRSPVCKFVTYDARGRRVELDGYKGVDMLPERQGQSDLYQVKLPIDGGGTCKWRLSNVTFGVTHGNPTRYGENVVSGAGGGVIVIFDDNASPRGGADAEVDGDLVIRRDYYPWISESFLGGYIKRISIAGEGYFYKTYKATTAREVYFEPQYHSKFELRSAGVKVKKEGNNPVYTYPDGTVYADKQWHPNFARLQAIRLKAEGKQ
ncbi:hypothetical protein [Pseudomonas huanghezhanensis]|uniref:hypothetical protein n=1 Tax=Pseudomonas huanghezhanensis TaxID=3002903 RepID=UPI0022866961|nr:hypothetical protein [Pseudomonas sp. BSw22131]